MNSLLNILRPEQSIRSTQCNQTIQKLPWHHWDQHLNIDHTSSHSTDLHRFFLFYVNLCSLLVRLTIILYCNTKSWNLLNIRVSLKNGKKAKAFEALISLLLNEILRTNESFLLRWLFELSCDVIKLKASQFRASSRYKYFAQDTTAYFF